MAKTADEWFDGEARWPAEVARLRELLLGCGLVETVKWGGPCYVHEGANVVGIGAFKSYFGLWFYQGALLDDDAGVLVNAQRGKTRAMRQWRMQAAKDIKAATVRRYVRAAMQLAAEGRAIAPRRDAQLDIPAELAARISRDQALAKAFRALRPGQQREYAKHVAEAKRADTRERRCDRITPLILAGGGLHDKYRR